MNVTRYRGLAGASLVASATLMVLGFTTAEAFFPGYSTSTQTISALGSARGTPGSRAIFNSTMVVAGLLLIGATYGLHRVYDRPVFTGAFAVTSVGLASVGLFPSETGLPHFAAAVVTFAGIGIVALGVATLVRGPFRYVSAALGGLELVSFVLFVTLGGSTSLGIGGLERWVAYLGLVWAAAFGGFLLGDGS